MLVAKSKVDKRTNGLLRDYITKQKVVIDMSAAGKKRKVGLLKDFFFRAEVVKGVPTTQLSAVERREDQLTKTAIWVAKKEMPLSAVNQKEFCDTMIASFDSRSRSPSQPTESRTRLCRAPE